MKTRLFPSIISAVMAFSAYSITQKDLDSGVYLLTDSSLALVGDSAIAWSDMSDQAAPNEQVDDDIPAEFADLAKRRPVEYAAVVKAFRQAYLDGRVVAMKDVIWRNYQIVR